VSKQRKTPFRQVAALAWRRAGDGTILVVLVTSRERHRWILPKGWPIRGLSDAQAAATEAMEEAGLVGTAAPRPVGGFVYDKRFPTKTETVAVDVYALKVERQLDDWPEKGQREVRWFTPAEAAAAAADRGVGPLILSVAAALAAEGAPSEAR
jgi:8-oxo-dGTP pyrophosphatase MutT (NUDIX family)